MPVLDALLKQVDPGALGASRGDFWRYIVTRTQPSDALFRLVAWQLLVPVAYLHAHGVAHRDLKNENFLVAGFVRSAAAPGEEVPVVKISDFGSARVLSLSDQLNVPASTARTMSIARGVNGEAMWLGCVVRQCRTAATAAAARPYDPLRPSPYG